MCPIHFLPNAWGCYIHSALTPVSQFSLTENISLLLIVQSAIFLMMDNFYKTFFESYVQVLDHKIKKKCFNSVVTFYYYTKVTGSSFRSQ